MWNCEYFAGNAQSRSKHFRRVLETGTVGVRLDDVHVVPNARVQ